MADKKIDPFDVDALERSLNDSATRVSAIWVTFLIFSLYLVTAAGTVTQRQLFLEEPTKLPVLNIELPLWWFFLLAPIFFVILHAYVLMQVMLLGRTAAAYNQALQQTALSPLDDALVRQRLANTLFAQIFAGSPRERTGPVGALLKLMMWLTLAIAPVLVLLAFQFRFLPYHSNFVTWAHRGLIFIELGTVFLLWPMVLDAAREMEWRRVLVQPVSLTLIVLLFLVSTVFATFPGEPLANLLIGKPPFSVQCQRWFAHHFDRFDLARIDVVDDEKLEKIENFSRAADRPPHQSERTRDLRGRDLNCGVFDFADLRRVDLTAARIQGSSLKLARLRGASLNDVELQGTSLDGADLAQASLQQAQLQGASLEGTELPGALLDYAQMQGANLNYAQLQGASLLKAQLQGASLRMVELQGAALNGTGLQGAAFDDDTDRERSAGDRQALTRMIGASRVGAKLQGASFVATELQGAFLEGAQLQGAFFLDAKLQGASLGDANLSQTQFRGVYVWRAKAGACSEARILELQSDAIIAEELAPATQDNVRKFIDRSIGPIPEGDKKQRALGRMNSGLVVDPSKNDAADLAKVWKDCETESGAKSQEQFDKDQASVLRDLICNATGNLKVAADSIISNWALVSIARDPVYAQELSDGLLGRNGQECPAVKDLSEAAKTRVLTLLLRSGQIGTSTPVP